MNTPRRYSNTGLIVGVTALTVLVGAALLIQQLFVSPALERERAALTKSLHIQQLLSVSGTQDDDTRTELASHLVVLRDGGEFAALNKKIYSLSESNSNDLISATNAIEEVLSQGGHSSLTLLTNNLIVAQQRVWAKFVKKVRWYRYIVGFNALLIVGFILAQLFRDFKRTKPSSSLNLVETEKSAEVDLLRATLKATLSASRDGLFLLKPSFQVGSVQSGAVRAIFQIKKPITGDFFDFLKSRVSARDLASAREYISLLLESEAKADMGTGNNPLNEVEIKFDKGRGVVPSKYLSFDFTRDQHKPDAGLWVTVRDVTREVELKYELLIASRANEERFALLLGSIADDSSGMTDFYRSSHDCLREINALLRKDHHEHGNDSDKLTEILQIARRLKSDAGDAGIVLLETSAHKFETRVEELLKYENVTNEQTLGLTKQLMHMISELDFLEQLTAKVKATKTSAPVALATPPSGALKVSPSHDCGSDLPGLVPIAQNITRRDVQQPLSSFTSIANDVAAPQNKIVRVRTKGFEDFTLSDFASTEIYSLCNQLIRNSITHGIESPEVRRKKGKSSEGQITISLEKLKNESVRLCVGDDGKGFDFNAIRNAAVDRGLVADDVVSGLKKSELIRFIFVSGFSTREQISPDANDGVGLDVVKSSVANLGGKISVKSTRDVSAHVTITLPISALSMSEADYVGAIFAEQASAG